MGRKIEPLLTPEEFENYREAFRKNEVTEDQLKALVKLGRMTPSQYGKIVRKVYSMYKDVRRDLIEE
jgi:hypothetical protein